MIDPETYMSVFSDSNSKGLHSGLQLSSFRLLLQKLVLELNLYNTIVVTAFTFDCHIFWNKCQQKAVQKSLNRLINL